MLSHLKIENFAIIEREELTLSQGFTVLTGETGAGKSIILDAITLLLGGRASADMVRRGADQALIEGRFTLHGEDLLMIQARLSSRHIPMVTLSTGSAEQEARQPLLAFGAPETQRAQGGELIVSRIVSLSGRNKARVNGVELKVSELKLITEGLIEIVRQHESYRLLDEESHLGTLDEFARLTAEASLVEEAFDQLSALERERKGLEASRAERHERLRALEQQIEQVERVNPEPHEDERLERELRVLRASVKLKGWVDEALSRLYERDGSPLEVIDQLGRTLEPLLMVDERLGAFSEALGRARLELDELTHDLRRYRGEIPTDQQTLIDSEQRQDQLERLKERYGLSLEAILAEVASASAERDALQALDRRVGEAASEAEQVRARALELAGRLSEGRAARASQLSALVEAELSTLGMAQCRFKVSFERAPLSRSGLDRVEFLISPNPGEGFKPLARIASGGELSRLTLALKVVLMHSDPTPTYVFDEVDSGIGGGVAEGVGQKLRRIAGARQVACITHLPQVASCAHHHMKIAKVLLSDRTFSSLVPLDERERVEELARMLGGQDMTEATYTHAREMIARGSRVDQDPQLRLTRPSWSEVGVRAARATFEPRAHVGRATQVSHEAPPSDEPNSTPK